MPVGGRQCPAGRFGALQTLGRDIAHGAGVESTIQWLSNQKSLSIADSLITRLTMGSAVRSCRARELTQPCAARSQ